MAFLTFRLSNTKLCSFTQNDAELLRHIFSLFYYCHPGWSFLGDAQSCFTAWHVFMMRCFWSTHFCTRRNKFYRLMYLNSSCVNINVYINVYYSHVFTKNHRMYRCYTEAEPCTQFLENLKTEKAPFIGLDRKTHGKVESMSESQITTKVRSLFYLGSWK